MTHSEQAIEAFPLTLDEKRTGNPHVYFERERTAFDRGLAVGAEQGRAEGIEAMRAAAQSYIDMVTTGKYSDDLDWVKLNLRGHSENAGLHHVANRLRALPLVAGDTTPTSVTTERPDVSDVEPPKMAPLDEEQDYMAPYPPINCVVLGPGPTLAESDNEEQARVGQICAHRQCRHLFETDCTATCFARDALLSPVTKGDKQ